VFERAIEQGVLSADINAGNYAGGFMYMGDKSGRHEFKNTITREYIRCNMPVVKG
jgi:hypothetical protein